MKTRLLAFVKPNNEYGSFVNKTRVINNATAFRTSEQTNKSNHNPIDTELSNNSRDTNYPNRLRDKFIDLTNDTTLSPKQPLVSRKLPFTPRANAHQGKNLNSQSKLQQTTKKDGGKIEQDSFLKSSIPCPFLIRRGRCLEGDQCVQCDFKHSAKSYESLKHSIPCPFLQKRGYCLKKNA